MPAQYLVLQYYTRVAKQHRGERVVVDGAINTFVDSILGLTPEFAN